MIDFESAQKRYLNESTSTMEVDSNANKRSRSPTLKCFESTSSPKGVTLSDFINLKELDGGHISRVHIVR
jgi:hypothetical protein